MKVNLLSLWANTIVFFGVVTSTLYSQDRCFELGENLSVEIKLEKHDYWAGEDISFVVEIHVKDSSVLNSWESILVVGGFSNGILGSASAARFNFNLKTDGVLLNSRKLIESTLKENLVGFYEAGRFLLRAEAENSVPCLFGIETFGNTAAIVVKNTFQKTDIRGPQVQSRTFDKIEIRAGETVVLNLNILDSSGVCSEELSSLGECSSVKHQGFATESGDLKMDFYEPLIRIDDDSFKVTVKVPDDAIPGQYIMWAHNLYDIFGNSNVEIPSYQAPTIRVIR